MATKFGIVRDPDKPKSRGISGKAEYVHKACEESLRRLGVDVIDLYYQHRVDPETAIEETVGARRRRCSYSRNEAPEVSSGKCGALDVSLTSEELTRIATALPRDAATGLRYPEAAIAIGQSLTSLRGYFLLPAALRLAAHLAFIASDNFLRPAAVRPPFLDEDLAELLADELAPVPFRWAQRALAAAASFARVAADIGRRPLERRRERAAPALLPVVEPPAPKRADNRRSRALICCLIETASVNLCRDKSMTN